MALCRVEHNQGVLGILLTICVCVCLLHTVSKMQRAFQSSPPPLFTQHTHTHTHIKGGERWRRAINEPGHPLVN